MVLYMHSVALHLGHLFIKIKKNLDLRAKMFHAYETKEHFCSLLERLLDQAVAI